MRFLEIYYPADHPLARGNPVTRAPLPPGSYIVIADDDKPAECNCQYPEVVARNMHGHGKGCPVGEKWKREHRAGKIYVPAADQT